MAFCIYCGKQLMEGARFCTYCGQSINGNNAMNSDSAGRMAPAPVAVDPSVKQQLYDAEVNEHTGFASLLKVRTEQARFASTLKARTEQDRIEEIFERGVAGFMDCIKCRAQEISEQGQRYMHHCMVVEFPLEFYDVAGKRNRYVHEVCAGVKRELIKEGFQHVDVTFYRLTAPEIRYRVTFSNPYDSKVWDYFEISVSCSW